MMINSALFFFSMTVLSAIISLSKTDTPHVSAAELNEMYLWVSCQKEMNESPIFHKCTGTCLKQSTGLIFFESLPVMIWFHSTLKGLKHYIIVCLRLI